MLSFITFEDLWTVAQIILGIGLLIFVHELGHFLVAKKLGVRVDIFSLGFGPPIWSAKRGDTEYRISALPLGGYVKLCGETAEDKLTGAPDEFMSRKPLERLLVFLAGATMNFLIAFPLAYVAYVVGVNFASPTVGDVSPGTLEWELGLEPGDEIVAINGDPIENFMDYRIGISLMPEGQTIALDVKRKGDLFKTALATKTPQTKSRLTLDASCTIQNAEPGYPGYDSGLREGDEVIAVNGKPIHHWQEVQRLIRENPYRPLVFEVSRSGSPEQQPLRFVVRPRAILQYGLFPPSRTVVMAVKPTCPAEGKLLPGDRILSISGQPVGSYKEVASIMEKAPLSPIPFEVERAGQRLTFEIAPRIDASGKPMIGVVFDDTPILGRVAAGSPLARANLCEGDRILYVGEKQIHTIADVDAAIRERDEPWQPVSLTIRRQDKGTQPETRERAPRPASVAWAGKRSCAPLLVIERVPPGFELEGFARITPKVKMVRVKGGAASAIGMAACEPFRVVGMTWNALRGIFREREIAKSVAGPIGIIQFSFLAAQEGFGQFIYLLLIITVNLAILNLLPVPVLDGGHILLTLIERIRGKRLAERTFRITQYAGLAVILTIFLSATYNDIRRILGI